MLSRLLIHKTILKQATLTPLLKPEIPVVEFNNKATDYRAAGSVFAPIPSFSYFFCLQQIEAVTCHCRQSKGDAPVTLKQQTVSVME